MISDSTTKKSDDTEKKPNDTEKNPNDTDKKDGIVPTLNLFDLTLLGLGNVIGAGIFVILGKTVLF
jgi:amino acid permease